LRQFQGPIFLRIASVLGLAKSPVREYTPSPHLPPLWGESSWEGGRRLRGSPASVVNAAVGVRDQVLCDLYFPAWTW